MPLGTYTGWNLRRPEVGAPDHLARWSGSFIPFARIEAERRAAGDPRPAIGARYRSRADYEAKVKAAAEGLARVVSCSKPMWPRSRRTPARLRPSSPAPPGRPVLRL